MLRSVLAMLACGSLPDIAAAETRSTCPLVTTETATVRSVTDGGIALDDGRTVHLAGIELNENAVAAPAGTAITLKRLATLPETDRYGRLIAHVFINEDGAERWLQADLVGRGLARVSPRVGDAGCAKVLFAREQSARTAKLGLWGEPYYVIVAAESGAELVAERGHFMLAEGKVWSVRESGGTIYVNFGRQWSQALTVTILKRNERMFAAAGIEPKRLENRRVRVRGWVEERNGPRIEATRPEQIEIAERN